MSVRRLAYLDQASMPDFVLLSAFTTLVCSTSDGGGVPRFCASARVLFISASPNC